MTSDRLIVETLLPSSGMLLVTAMVLNQVWLIMLIAGDMVIWAVAILAAFLALGLYQLFRFIRLPSAEGREKNEAVVALTMLAGYAVVIAVVIAGNGLTLMFI